MRRGLSMILPLFEPELGDDDPSPGLDQSDDTSEEAIQIIHMMHNKIRNQHVKARARGNERAVLVGRSGRRQGLTLVEHLGRVG